MKRTLGLLGSLTVAGLGVLAISAPAHAEVPSCKTVLVNDRVGADSGENNNIWATVTIDRTLKVCTAGGEGETWTYKATVTDNGTFVTLPGESPGIALTALTGGFNGKVVGGFEATFTAPKVGADWKLISPPKATTTDKWVATAFPGAKFDSKGSVAKWGWTYTNTTCSGEGQKWVNAEAGNSGDITEKACAVPTTPPATKPPTSEPKKCEAYLYTNTTKNLCDRFANRTNQVNCTEVGTWVTLKDYRVDPWGLDGAVGAKYDGDKGIGCEGFQTTPSPSHTTTPPVAGGGNDNGGLPVTGDKVKTIGVIGGVLLVGGVIATVVTRRRKGRFVA